MLGLVSILLDYYNAFDDDDDYYYDDDYDDWYTLFQKYKVVKHMEISSINWYSTW